LKFFKFTNIFRKKSQLGWAGLWLDESDFLEAVREVKKSGWKNFTTISPFPVHGLEEAEGTPRSWIPWVTFIFGTLGCLFGLWFTWWTSTVSWPIIIGGKPLWSLPAFIPVIFELTILFAALSSIVALFYACGLPHINPPMIDPDLTCHKFAIFIPLDDKNKTQELKSLLHKLKPDQVLETEF